MFNANQEKQMKQPTIQQFKKWAAKNADLARAVVLAQAFAKAERERVDAYINPIFDSFTFYVCDEFAEGERRRITKPSDLYLADLDSPEVAAYHAACAKAHREHGFTGPTEHCPALVAEMIAIDAERTLLKTTDELLGVDFSDLYGENRKKGLDLLLGAALKQAA